MSTCIELPVEGVEGSVVLLVIRSRLYGGLVGGVPQPLGHRHNGRHQHQISWDIDGHQSAESGPSSGPSYETMRLFGAVINSTFALTTWAIPGKHQRSVVLAVSAAAAQLDYPGARCPGGPQSKSRNREGLIDLSITLRDCRYVVL